MKIYRHHWGDDVSPNRSADLTEDQVIEEYWETWVKLMIKRHGPKCNHITRENCIDDWIIANYAYEVKEKE